jgi:CheY-like chemotaxis protein
MEGEGLMRVTAANVTLAANEVGDVRAGEYVRISVTDTGCGMTTEVMERAFEPFFTTKPVGKGTGLGLSQIFGFAHQSGGEVGIESRLGKGTSVSIYLPRTAAPEAIRLHPAMQRADNEATVPGARILVVEDDPRVRSSTIEALQDLDYDPVACGSGAEAIDIFESRTFDLVISDVIMPEMTGPELIKHLKQTHDDFAVLFVTGYVGEGETGDLVGHELLRKPFTVGALANAVAVALSRRPTNEPRRSGGAAAAG